MRSKEVAVALIILGILQLYLAYAVNGMINNAYANQKYLGSSVRGITTCREKGLFGADGCVCTGTYVTYNTWELYGKTYVRTAGYGPAKDYAFTPSILSVLLLLGATFSFLYAIKFMYEKE